MVAITYTQRLLYVPRILGTHIAHPLCACHGHYDEHAIPKCLCGSEAVVCGSKAFVCVSKTFVCGSNAFVCTLGCAYHRHTHRHTHSARVCHSLKW